jgi:hypothetical protein
MIRNLRARLSGFAVFHLGNNGTAQRELKKWDVGSGDGGSE